MATKARILADYVAGGTTAAEFDYMDGVTSNVQTQMDMMYKDTKNSTTTHAAAVEAVKTKWPKDNSGPV